MPAVKKELGIDSALEERKVILEERKLETDKEFRRRELDLKERENGWFTKLFSPLTTTLIAGMLTLAATLGGTLFQGRQTLQLEREKFAFSKDQETQKEEHELILKMISVGNIDQAKDNLHFLVDVGLIRNKTLAENILRAKITPVLPVPNGQPALPSPDCTNAQPENFVSKLINVQDESIYLESCVLDVPGAVHGFYCYVYRIENRGTKALAFIWHGVGIVRSIVAPLPPGRAMSRSNFSTEAPRVSNTDIVIGENGGESSTNFEAFLPSQSQ
jgi:hypothetical protein